MYAVLGATGNTGQCLLEVLLQNPGTKVNAYCRSKEKLLDQSSAAIKDGTIRIFEGSLGDIDLLTECLRGTRAAFLVVAGTGNMPGCCIARETAQHALTAVKRLKVQDEPLPKLILLSSASLDHALMPNAPRFLLKILWAAFSNRYEDIRQAEDLLRAQHDLVSSTFVRPGALSHDTQKGHWLSTKVAKGPLSYMDLAAGMVEIAQNDRFDMKGVAVNPRDQNVAFPWQAPMMLIKGLIVHFLPWTYHYLH